MLIFALNTHLIIHHIFPSGAPWCFSTHLYFDSVNLSIHFQYLLHLALRLAGSFHLASLNYFPNLFLYLYICLIVFYLYFCLVECKLSTLIFH